MTISLLSLFETRWAITRIGQIGYVPCIILGLIIANIGCSGKYEQENSRPTGRNESVLSVAAAAVSDNGERILAVDYQGHWGIWDWHENRFRWSRINLAPLSTSCCFIGDNGVWMVARPQSENLPGSPVSLLRFDGTSLGLINAEYSVAAGEYIRHFSESWLITERKAGDAGEAARRDKPGKIVFLKATHHGWQDWYDVNRRDSAGAVVVAQLLDGDRAVLIRNYLRRPKDSVSCEMVIIDIANKTELERIPLDYVPASVATSHNGRFIVAANDETVAVYSVADLAEVDRFTPGSQVDHPRLAISPDGKYVAFGTYRVEIRNTQTKKIHTLVDLRIRCEAPSSTSDVESSNHDSIMADFYDKIFQSTELIKFVANGETLLMINRYGTILSWSVDTWEMNYELRANGLSGGRIKGVRTH